MRHVSRLEARIKQLEDEVARLRSTLITERLQHYKKYALQEEEFSSDLQELINQFYISYNAILAKHSVPFDNNPHDFPTLIEDSKFHGW